MVLCLPFQANSIYLTITYSNGLGAVAFSDSVSGAKFRSIFRSLDFTLTFL